jgi:hypothetical protein
MMGASVARSRNDQYETQARRKLLTLTTGTHVINACTTNEDIEDHRKYALTSDPATGLAFDPAVIQY